MDDQLSYFKYLKSLAAQNRQTTTIKSKQKTPKNKKENSIGTKHKWKTCRV
jgi:hypothetical protein